MPIAMACFESWVEPQSRKVALSNTVGKAYKTYHTAFSFMPEENFTHFITLKLPFTSLPVACDNGVARHWETAHYFHHQCLPLGIFLTLLTNTLLLAKVKPWTSLECWSYHLVSASVFASSVLLKAGLPLYAMVSLTSQHGGVGRQRG